MMTYSIHEEAPPGNFTLLTECDSLEACHAFARGQPGRILRVTNPDGERRVVLATPQGDLSDEPGE